MDNVIGYLIPFAKSYKALCVDCAAKRTTYAGTDIETGHKIGAPLYAVNLGQYQQHCLDCGESINPNANNHWPELFDGKY